MALAMLITIGGVYATWTYQNGVIEGKHMPIGKIGLTDVETDGSKGAITVNSTVEMLIDDADDNHKPDELTVNGNITITYRPSTDYPVPVALYYHLGLSDPAKEGTDKHVQDPATYDKLVYEEKQIFTKYDTSNQVIQVGDLTDNGDGSYSFVITAEKIKELIKINGDITLDTYQEYQDYESLLFNVNYGITVGEYTTLS